MMRRGEQRELELDGEIFVFVFSQDWRKTKVSGRMTVRFDISERFILIPGTRQKDQHEHEKIISSSFSLPFQKVTPLLCASPHSKHTKWHQGIRKTKGPKCIHLCASKENVTQQKRIESMVPEELIPSLFLKSQFVFFPPSVCVQSPLLNPLNKAKEWRVQEGSGGFNPTIRVNCRDIQKKNESTPSTVLFSITTHSFTEPLTSFFCKTLLFFVG